MARAEPAGACGPAIDVEIAYSPRAGEVLRRHLALPGGATAADAVAACGWDLPTDLSLAIWGRACAASEPLRDRDRVELCRALAVDPKEARRLRYAKKPRRAGA